MPGTRKWIRGKNGLRTTRTFAEMRVTEEQLEILEEIAKEQGIKYSELLNNTFQDAVLRRVETYERVVEPEQPISLYPPGSPLCAACKRPYSAQEKRAGYELCEHCEGAT